MTVHPAAGRLSPEMAAARDRAAQAAVALVENGMIVGLGTGDTATRFIERLGRRVHDERLSIRCVVTSEATAARAREHELPLGSLAELGRVDLAVDGADEVSARLDLLKGGGGAMTREKIVVASAQTFVVLVDEGKLVDVLGLKHPIPVETVPEAVALVTRRLEALGSKPGVRMATGSKPFVTDLGHHIVDARFPGVEDPTQLNAALNDIPGVVGHGLFVGLATIVLVGAIGTPDVRRLAGGVRT
ncbi:MAG: ribose-5-phosphate isomerase RpiA [Candidatus Eiseniibacteriota bacterium]